ncbi:MAG: GTP-binding protein [Dehalococcoidia bacterium]|nr:GTP-binding protein [Dehalococcoidia bacterium]MDD5494042.1 GTP-binding protein [Dehalococcoidia bacterium]
MKEPIKKKICMLGAFAVGKTSLIKRYVEDMFSEKYHTTIGVKVDKKTVKVDDRTVDLILWDLAGKNGISEMRTTYLRGASGYLLVVDKTRVNTLDVAMDMHKMAQDMLGKVPCILILNKWDLEGKWDIDEAAIEDLRTNGWYTIKTSAKTGMSVNQAFETLARKLVE